MTGEELDALIVKHAAQLREHVDAVRIFVSVDPEQGESTTLSATTGSGNLFAQLGQVKDWIIEQDEITKRDA